MICYKLTDREGYTRRGRDNETLWGEGVTHTATGNGGLCTGGVIHAYASPELALFMNPAHANITVPLVWECDGETLVEDDGTKQGFRTLTTLHTIEVSSPTSGQCARFGILCAKTVYNDAKWNEWADNWLDGTDRTAASANAAYAAYTAYTAYAAYAAYAAAYAAANAAYAAVYAADAAANAAYAAYNAAAARQINAMAKRAMEESK